MRISAYPLRLEAVSYAVGERRLIDAVTLDVQPGEMLGLLGPNGAGKSTLLRTIYRVNRPSSGTVHVDGENVWNKPASWVARRVGAVLQDMPADFPLTVRDVIAMGRSAHKKVLEPDTDYDRALIDAAIALLDLEALESRAFRTLSGGERQRALVARAMVQQPGVLVLDEPTNHLDIYHQLHLLQFVRELGITVIAALHDLNLAAMFCDRLCVLHEGRVAALGTPDAVLTPDLLAHVYRIDATIALHPKRGTAWVVPG